MPFDRILDVVGDRRRRRRRRHPRGAAHLRRPGAARRWSTSAPGGRRRPAGPLPLGGNGIRRDLDEALKRRLCRLLTESIDYGLDHRGEALGYAIRYARGLEDDPERSDRFVGMYVNDWTRDYGEAGRRAVQLLLDRGHEAGVLPRRVVAEFVDLG